MGFFDFFKKKREVYHISVFDNEWYPYSPADFENHGRLFANLTFEQKCALVYPIGCFYKTFIPEATGEWEESADLCAQRERLLGVTFDEAGQTLCNHDGLLAALTSIENRQITDILLQDMKFLLKTVVYMNVRYADGAENNKLAVESLLSIFIPIGYAVKDVYDNKRDFVMY
jgi:hypothetical protein